MDKKLNVTQPILTTIKRHTIESVSKYFSKSYKTLIELITIFPNSGQNFKVFLKRRPQDYYIVDHLNLKNNRHGKVFGVFYRNGEGNNKVTKIRNVLKPGVWTFEPLDGKTYSENGVEYDIKTTELLIEEKKNLLAERNKMLGYVDYRRKLTEEKKLKPKTPPKKK